MRAMILAAGRGERMRPLTDHTPKPLLMAGGKPLIVWHLERLRAAGFCEVVINHAHLGEMIEKALGDGRDFGVSISYSAEPPGALETAGGIRHALPLLGEEPFLVINGDVFCDWPLAEARRRLAADDLAHLVLVPNPEHHPHGDFALVDGRLRHDDVSGDGEATVPFAASAIADRPPRYTFSGIGIYRPQLFSHLPDNTSARLAPLLFSAADANCISGELHGGDWIDVGTPERLADLTRTLCR